MKYVWLIIAVGCAAALLVWWWRSRAAPRDIDSALAQMLANMFGAQGIAASVDGNTVQAAGHRVRLDPMLENILQNAHGYTIGVAVEVVLDGVRRPSLTVGTIGVAADDEAAALTQAFEEWGALCGLSLVAALGHDAIVDPVDGLPEPCPAGEHIVYPGLIGTRGEAPELTEVLGDEPGTAILAELGDDLAARFSDGHAAYHGLLINVAIDGAEREEHCLVDGEHAPDIGERVLALPWPDGTYMFKQFFLFVRDEAGQLGMAAAASADTPSASAGTGQQPN